MQEALSGTGRPAVGLDLRLAALGRGVGAMRLGIGEGLVRLEQVGGVRVLGFGTLESYAREALGRSGRWAAEVRALARRLEGLPVLREALVSGALGASKVELVARVATAETDAAWVERARAMTVRALRAELAAARIAVTEEDERPARVTLTTNVDRVDAWAFERARLMLEAVGARRGDETIEALLAEGLTELIAAHPGIDLPSSLTVDFEGEARSVRAEQAALREAEEAALREAEEAAREAARGGDDALGTVADGAAGHEPWRAWIEAPWPEGAAVPVAQAIDVRQRALARELAWRDLELAAMALEADEEGLWRKLGYASSDHYCRERIGMAPATLASRVALARRVRQLPEIAGAVADGRIGYEAATLIARVAGPRTVRDWIDRAEARTVKLLREEVQAVELVARAEGVVVQNQGPPTTEALEAVRAIERGVIGLVTGLGDGPAETGGPMSGREAGGSSGPMSGREAGRSAGPMSGREASESAGPMSGREAGESAGPMSGREAGENAGPISVGDDGESVGPMSVVEGGRVDSGLPMIALRLSMSEDTARFWRGLEGLHQQLDGGRGSFVAFLVASAMRAWSSAMSTQVAYGDVYVRDRWRCASPTCRSRNVTPHHVKFRSRGGGEERANLVSLCETCHLDLVHSGWLLVSGAAPDGLTWEALGWRA